MSRPLIRVFFTEANKIASTFWRDLLVQALVLVNNKSKETNSVFSVAHHGAIRRCQGKLFNLSNVIVSRCGELNLKQVHYCGCLFSTANLNLKMFPVN